MLRLEHVVHVELGVAARRRRGRRLPGGFSFFQFAFLHQEIDKRKAAWKPLVTPPARGYAKLYMEHVLQAEQGCDFDFLRKA